MLVEKSVYENGNYVVMKLSSGDEVVTQIKVSNNDNLFVKQPLQVTIMRGPDGQPGKALMPFMMLAPESEVEIRKSAIVAIAIAPGEVEKAYIQETSGLVIAR